MYSLIIVFAILSPSGSGAVTPVGVTSQILARFRTVDQCKTAANKEGAAGNHFRSKPFERSLLAMRVCRAEVMEQLRR
jgi:hypothetical protein